MRQDILVSIHRWSRGIAPRLGPLGGIARLVFRGLLRLRYPSGTLVTAEQNGRAWRMSPDVALRGALQEFETISWFRAVARPGMTAIDVGANVGQMSLELATLVGPKGKVIAIEPAPGNLDLLRQHVRANGLEARVQVVEAACADTHGGEVEFHVFGESAASIGSGHSLIGAETLHQGDTEISVHSIRCARISIDGLCEEYDALPSLIKIDVEGGELQVLRGAMQTLARARPVLRIGFHPFAFSNPVQASDELRRIIASSGYHLEDAPSVGALELAEYVAVPIVDPD